MKKIIFLILFAFVFTACKKQQKTAFYYWKTNFKISTFEQNYLTTLGVKKLYVHFFDVEIKNGMPNPVGKIQIQQKNNQQQIIPVVFITNETFKAIDKKNCSTLATNIVNEILFFYKDISDKKLQEIQFDCDWTVSTKENYFYFLKELKKQFPAFHYTTTIRLHQIKDKEKMGVPPVKKGVLMYYATSNPLDFSVKNSILEPTLAENYCKNIADYPLLLDVALPIYSWAIIENNLGEKILLNGIRHNMLADSMLYEKIKPNFYTIKKDHYLRGNYLYKGYTIKVETVAEADILRTKIFLRQKIKNKELNTLFFQLDSSNLVPYSLKTFNPI